MNNKLIISDFHKEQLLGFHIQDDSLYRIYNFSEDSLVGNIYCGYVKDVVKNLNAAFVEFDKDKKGYYVLNNQLIKPGDTVLVQVSSDKIKTKDYGLSSNINLNSDNLVLTVGSTGINISRKIKDELFRSNIKQELCSYANSEFGFIVRTNAIGTSIDVLKAEADLLIAKWYGIKKNFEHASPKSVIIRNDKFTTECKEFISKYNGEIIVDKLEIYNRLDSDKIPVIFNEDSHISLSNKYSLGKHLKTAISSKVWLKSGAYLVIEPTEALTVIDVNTGKAETKGDRENTFKKINIEAAQEVAKQLRIRNLSGIIIIDFINMKNQENYKELINELKAVVNMDFTQCNVIGFTNLGLLEMTRRKKEKPLYESIK